MLRAVPGKRNLKRNARSPDFLPPRLLMTASCSELKRVISQLKGMLVEALQKRRETTRAVGSPITQGSARVASDMSAHSTGIRRSTRMLKDALLRVNSEVDATMNSNTLRSRCLCLESFLVTKTPPRVPSRETKAPVGRLRFSNYDDPNRTSQSVMNRLSLKLDARKTVVAASAANADNDSESEKEDVDVLLSRLRSRVLEIKKREGAILKKSGFTPKQLLNEYSTYGLKMKKNANQRSLDSAEPAKEIVSLIETVDRRLSTTDALAVLKELGIEYQPRSALGKKNVMATGLSSLLASNGLKLISTDDPTPVEATPGTHE